MVIKILGSGTSHGIPVVGCRCSVCSSGKKRNKRSRSSILISDDNTDILIDTATEFRLQAIRENIQSIDAIFFTHSHADHLHGLDDIRPLTYLNPINVFASSDDVVEIKNRFPYIFNNTTQKGGGKPRLNLNEIFGNEILINNIRIQPIPVKHGVLDIFGYKIDGKTAYITDCSYIPEESMNLLRNVDVLVIGALRYRNHPTHFNISQALEVIKKISPERAYLTHLSHDVDHDILSAELPGGIFPAYDGLKITI